MIYTHGLPEGYNLTIIVYDEKMKSEEKLYFIIPLLILNNNHF